MEPLPSGLNWSSERYQLRELVGSGGMSQVYRAWDRQLDREVAVKVLHPHLALSPDSRKRFSREAKAVAKLHHPHILEIFDFSGDGEGAFIVTEFIQGPTLRRFADEVGFGLPQIGALAAHSLCLALEHAHAAGIVHRDLKPENVMVDDRAGLKLMDFGIARFLDQGEKMTMTGAMVGSPAYMAPEVIEGHEADARSDLFSLGTVLYWLLSGTLPFDAPNTSALLKRVLDVVYVDPRLVNPQVSDALAEVVASLLTRDPRLRPESAQAVRLALARALAEDQLTDPERELKAFLAEPKGYRGRFRGELLAGLRGQAQAALREGRPIGALKLADRMLALEPADPDAKKILDAVSALKRRRKRLKLAIYAAGGLLCAVGAGAMVREVRRAPLAVAPSHDASPLPSASASADPTPVNLSSVAPEAALTKGPAAVPPVSHLRNLFGARGPAGNVRGLARPLPAVAPGPPPPPITVPYHVLPFADVRVDEIQVAKDTRDGELKLTPGHHQITFSAAAYQPRTFDLDVNPMTPPQRLRLVPKPARLVVRADPPDATVMVDDEPRGSAAETTRSPLPLPLPEDRPESSATVRVFKTGYQDVVRTVQLRANEEVTLQAALKLTPRAQDPR